MIEILKYEDIEKYKKLIDDSFDVSNNLDFYKKYSENRNYTIIVYKENDIVIGSVTFYRIDLFTFSFQPCLEIFNVAVLPSYREKGIGKALVNYVKKYAKENGYNQIYLTCLDNARSAHKLYESVGFKRASSIKYFLNIS